MIECDPSVQSFKADKSKSCDPIPTLQYIDVTLAAKTDADLPRDKPILLVLFNPTCGHCEDFCKKLVSNNSLLQEATIFFITGEPNAGSIGRFAKNMHLDTIPNFIVAADRADFTKTFFEYKGVPQIMAYDNKHRLRYIFYEDAEIETIATFLFK